MRGRDRALRSIEGVGKVTALAVDERTGRVWFVADEALHGYGLDGQWALTVPLDGKGPGSEALPALDGGDSSVYAAWGKTLQAVDADGATRFVVRGGETIGALSVDPQRGLIWAAGKTRVTAYDRDGRVLRELELGLGKHGPAAAMAFDPHSQVLWVATPRKLLGYGEGPDPSIESGVGQITCLRAHGQGGLWALRNGAVVRMGTEGRVELEVKLPPSRLKGPIRALAADGLDHGCWVVSSRVLARVSFSGDVLQVADLSR